MVAVCHHIVVGQQVVAASGFEARRGICTFLILHAAPGVGAVLLRRPPIVLEAYGLLGAAQRGRGHGKRV